jgi:hypothetical protein
MTRKISDIISDMRNIVKPCVGKLLKLLNYDNSGNTDKAEFETEFEMVLTLAETANNQWIPCSERMPKDGEDVMIYYERDAFNDEGVFRKKEIGVGWHIKRLWHVDGCSRVEGIARTPLPKPYEPQESEE